MQVDGCKNLENKDRTASYYYYYSKFSQYKHIHTMYSNTGKINPCSNQEQWIHNQNKQENTTQ